MAQRVKFAEDTLNFQVGTGKDAKIFIKFIVKQNDKLLLYNIPLLTLNSIQIWTSKPKIPRWVMGNADPVGLSVGIRTISGFITASTENVSLGSMLRKALKEYHPVNASELNLDTEGIVTIDKLDEVRYLDQLPPCQINIYISNPTTGKVFSKAVYGVEFSNESHGIGTSANMGAQYSFVARDIAPIKLEEISEKKGTTEAKPEAETQQNN